MEPLYIGTDTAFAKGQAENFSAAKRRIQHTLNLYAAIGLSALTQAEFARLFLDTKGLLYRKIVGKGGGAQLFNPGDGEHVDVDKSAAFDIIKKPEGCDALLADVAKLPIELQDGWVAHSGQKLTFPIDEIPNLFMLDQEGELQYSDKTVKRLSEAGKRYLITEKGQAHYKFVQALQKAFIDSGLFCYYKPAYGHMSGGGIETIQVLVKAFLDNISADGQTFTASPNTYQKLDSPSLSGAFF